jgi:hypothetical protein
MQSVRNRLTFLTNLAYIFWVFVDYKVVTTQETKLYVIRNQSLFLESKESLSNISVCICVLHVFLWAEGLFMSVYRVSGLEVHKNVLVPKSFIKFMFSTFYRVTQKDFYAHPYTFELLCTQLKTQIL